MTRSSSTRRKLAIDLSSSDCPVRRSALSGCRARCRIIVSVPSIPGSNGHGLKAIANQRDGSWALGQTPHQKKSAAPLKRRIAVVLRHRIRGMHHSRKLLYEAYHRAIEARHRFLASGAIHSLGFNTNRTFVSGSYSSLRARRSGRHGYAEVAPISLRAQIRHCLQRQPPQQRLRPRSAALGVR